MVRTQNLRARHDGAGRCGESEQDSTPRRHRSKDPNGGPQSRRPEQACAVPAGRFSDQAVPHAGTASL